MLTLTATKFFKMLNTQINLHLTKNLSLDMSKLNIKYLILTIAILASSGLIAQEDDKETIGSETVVVVKPYTPSVSDAFKVKQTPQLLDSITLQKKSITYKIFSVPVASTFTPTKGTAARVEKARPIQAFDSYATLGVGNYTSAFAEFYTNFEINRGENFGINFKHNSAQGGIDDVLLDDNYYDTNLGLDYSFRDRDLSYTIGLDALHKQYNWYGFSNNIIVTNDNLNRTDVVQNYFGAGLRANLSLNDSFLDQTRFGLSVFGDSYGSSEINATLKPEMEFEIAGEKIQTNVSVDYLNTSFDQNYEGTTDLASSYLNLGLSPSILILRDDLELNLGASVFYSLDSESSESNIFVYPNINASYRLAGEYFIAYAGLNGELKQNSYKGFVDNNPFVSPTLAITPTDQQYVGSLGAKGKLSDVISYNIKGSYANVEAQPLFKSNTNTFPLGGLLEDYEYGNSFGVVYDNIKTVSFFGELNFDITKVLRLGVNAEYFSYNTDTQEEAWNLPELKASLLADYKISDKFTAGANLFFVGERQAQASDFDMSGNLTTENITLDSYIDANVQLNYLINDQLSFFVKGNNLFADSYEKWLNFPVYGIQGMAGATYKFDW